MMQPGFKRADATLLAVACGLLLAVLVADILTPLGVSVWVFYVIPCALGYLTWRPWAPIAIAALSTGLVVLGFFLSPPGIAPALALMNRAFGVGTIWVIALTGFIFVRNKLAVSRNEWLQTTHLNLSSAMTGEQELGELGFNILQFLTDVLDSPVAALYVREETGLRRCATLGVPAEGGAPETIDIDDGLVGLAARNQRPILVDTPPGYLTLGSSLGRATPDYLFVAPASVDGAAVAVLELGFARRLREPDQALLARVSPSVGLAVRSALYRAKLRELLEETQQQAEELQVQSEELRASNDELEQQSRALQDSQARLELQQAELEQTNAQLEEQAQLLEGQRDDLSQAQSALQKQARDLEQASRYKSEFLANMSHELRTPLNSLLIMARLLADNREGNLSGDQIKFAQTIETSGNDLLLLINDILDISKIEAGRVDLRPSRVEIRSMVEKLQAQFGTLAAEKGLSLKVEIEPDAPASIETDGHRMEQVLKNLLSNAVKFTDAGEVALRVRSNGHGTLAFDVTDTGIGIASEHQQTVFEPFRQAEGGVARRHTGTGLGLSISRELARLLGGDVQLESAVDRGSVFTLTVPEVFDPRTVTSPPNMESGLAPVAPTPTSEARKVAKAATSRRTSAVEDDRDRLGGDSRIILVVEDDTTFANILCGLVRELGFHCLVAGSADEGVIAARQYMPEAIILDVGLPDHSGLTVLDRLKRDTRTRHIPIHVVSVSDYTQTARSFGAVSYMLKPVKREELIEALQTLEARFAQRLRRVLIVEDDATQLAALKDLIESRDVEATGAASAGEALDKLASGTFDCMVLDLSLPDATGFEFLQRISQDETFAFPPVIVYTGRDLSLDEELLLRKYSKSIIIKGARSPERLLDEVTLFLHQVVADLPEKQQLMLAKSLHRDSTLEGRRVLIVEDDIRNVFVLTSLLEQHGVQIRVARNGREAITVLEDSEAEPIELVLMDVMMPELDGISATREIRSRPQWHKLPIIMLTAKAMPDDQEQSLSAGATDYLAKPIDVDKLLSLVRVWMPR